MALVLMPRPSMMPIRVVVMARSSICRGSMLVLFYWGLVLVLRKNSVSRVECWLSWLSVCMVSLWLLGVMGLALGKMCSW